MGSSSSDFFDGSYGSYDFGYNGGRNPRSFSENIDSLKNHFDFKNGYFGEKGTKSDRRRIESDSPIEIARSFYDIASEGGLEEPLSNGKGVMSTLKDGTVVTMREISNSVDRSPAVDINIRKSIEQNGVKNQRIHFVKRKK